MSDSGPHDRIDDRIAGNRYWILLLVRANRWYLTAGVLAAICVLLLLASQLGLAPVRRVAASQNGLRYLFSAFIGAIITGTSVVVTINQLVLSQELGAVGDQRTRMQESMAYQRDVESVLDTGISPPEPSAFLAALVDGITHRASRLSESVDTHDEDLLAVLDEFIDDVQRNSEEVSTALETAQFGTFSVIWAALGYNYSRKIHQGRLIRNKHGEALSSEASETLDELIELLEFFGEAREHFKTLYFQWELINLSRSLLYIAIPALVLMGGLIMYVDATTLMGTTLGIDDLVWVASAGFTIGIAPFVVFTVFIVRIITVAKRTLAMGPFILRRRNTE